MDLDCEHHQNSIIELILRYMRRNAYQTQIHLNLESAQNRYRFRRKVSSPMWGSSQKRGFSPRIIQPSKIQPQVALYLCESQALSTRKMFSSFFFQVIVSSISFGNRLHKSRSLYFVHWDSYGRISETQNKMPALNGNIHFSRDASIYFSVYLLSQN